MTGALYCYVSNVFYDTKKKYFESFFTQLATKSAYVTKKLFLDNFYFTLIVVVVLLCVKTESLFHGNEYKPGSFLKIQKTIKKIKCLSKIVINYFCLYLFFSIYLLVILFYFVFFFLSLLTLLFIFHNYLYFTYFSHFAQVFNFLILLFCSVYFPFYKFSVLFL